MITTFLIFLYLLFGTLFTRWLYRWMTETMDYPFNWSDDGAAYVAMFLFWPLCGLVAILLAEDFWDTPIFGPRRQKPPLQGTYIPPSNVLWPPMPQPPPLPKRDDTEYINASK